MKVALNRSQNQGELESFQKQMSQAVLKWAHEYEYAGWYSCCLAALLRIERARVSI